MDLSPGQRDAFRGYDIRGVVGVDFSSLIAERIGLAFGSHVQEAGGGPIIVGYDGRPSGAELTNGLVAGLLAGGVDVIELGVVPTPLVYFCSSQMLGSFGVSVTASHLAAAWNGFKFCQGNMPIHTDLVRDLLERGMTPSRARGTRRDGRDSAIRAYQATLARLMPDGSSMTVVLDCQNAAASQIAPQLFESMGFDVHVINVNLGDPYPFETPDPQMPRHLEPLMEAVLRLGADAGFAFDGDADRLGVVDETGRRMPADIGLALLADDVLVRHPGATVVYDVLMSPVVEEVVRRAGGNPVEAKSGHAFVQSLIHELGAPVGGEGSGHVFFADSYRGPTLGYDDAIYAALRLVEYRLRMGSLAGRAAELPLVIAGDEWRPQCPDGLKRRIVEDVRQQFLGEGLRVTDVDGAKAHLGPLSWALVRAANTEPALSVRVVGPNAEAVARHQEEVVAVVRRIAARHNVGL